MRYTAITDRTVITHIAARASVSARAAAATFVATAGSPNSGAARR
jgi:hypothetical protein